MPLVLFHSENTKQNVLCKTEMSFFKNLNFTYTFCVNRVHGKEEASEQRGLGSLVQHSTFFIIGKSPNQYSKHINHKGGYDSMEYNVQHMKANRMQASCQEVVQPEKGRWEICYAKHWVQIGMLLHQLPGNKLRLQSICLKHFCWPLTC